MTEPRADADTATDEIALIARLRAGDEDAFMELVERYNASLLRLARTYVSSKEAAEEVVQDTWIGVLNGIERFEGRSSLKTWLFRILVNRAQTSGKKEARSVPFSAFSSGADGEEGDFDPDRFFAPGHQYEGHWTSQPGNWSELPEVRLESDETLAIIREAIAALPEMQRRVITLRDIELWTSEEVRNELEITETNQRVLLHRARGKVRKALESHFAGGR